MIKTEYRQVTAGLLFLAGAVAMFPVTACAQEQALDYRVTRVRFYPRAGHAAEMVGGHFIGSLTSATNEGFFCRGFS